MHARDSCGVKMGTCTQAAVRQCSLLGRYDSRMLCTRCARPRKAAPTRKASNIRQSVHTGIDGQSSGVDRWFGGVDAVGVLGIVIPPEISPRSRPRSRPKSRQQIGCLAAWRLSGCRGSRPAFRQGSATLARLAGAFTYTQTHTYTHTFTRTRTYTYTHTFTHTRTHTYTFYLYLYLYMYLCRG